MEDSNYKKQVHIAKLDPSIQPELKPADDSLKDTLNEEKSVSNNPDNSALEQDGEIINSEQETTDNNELTDKKYNYSTQELKAMLEHQPHIFKFILFLKRSLRKKQRKIKELKQLLKDKETIDNQEPDSKTVMNNSEWNKETKEVANGGSDAAPWKVETPEGTTVKSIAEQVAEVAQSALSETGMVYVESAGMYYDYKTGYYYNTELGLYYHTDTGCYYHYSEEKKEFVFHSYPDTSKVNMALVKHEKKKAKKQKQDNEGPITKKKKKDPSVKKNKKKREENSKTDKLTDDMEEGEIDKEIEDGEKKEDGECSETESESDAESCVSNSTVSVDDDSVVKHHPPCMRVIVQKTSLPKLKVGSLFVITKDGGTVGREGDHHAILLRDENVSREHIEIKYDQETRSYYVIDLGSKNGSVLNGQRISESQVVSVPVQIVHGSTLQLGETKLLCHIHAGNDTCGHCEPGLIMEDAEKEKRTAYTRTCSVQKQHQLELARLKNLYQPQPLAIEDGAYNDRAKARRETVGSSHESEKTQQADLDSCIPEDNMGFKMLSKMGWAKGEGLGKDSQGDVEPIPLVSNENKVGLGAAGSAAPVTVGAIGSMPLRVKQRARPLRPPAKLFRDPLEEDDDE